MDAVALGAQKRDGLQADITEAYQTDGLTISRHLIPRARRRGFDTPL
jgi:hypothetical protein